MAFRFGLDAIMFSDETRIELPDRGVLALVGPNNAGKSAALRDIVLRIGQPPQAHVSRVVTGVEVAREGTIEDLEAWLREHAFRRVNPDGTVYFKRVNVDGAWDALRAEWAVGGPTFPMLSSYTVFQAWADSRLGLVHPSASYDPMSDSPGNPMQVLFARPELEQRISETSAAAFDTPLVLSRVPGNTQLTLYLGTVETEPSVIPSQAYMDELRGLAALHEQGDGVRSFMGIMLSLVTSQYPLILIDEPEAFLHPPQARLLGRRLASDVPAGTQVIVATHSIDVLQGLLDAHAAEVTVARIRRNGSINEVSVLPPDDLRTLWRDPLLRASNTLAGLFHRGVVACEADSDARFYDASLNADRLVRGLGSHDYLFTYASTKDRLPLVAGSLSALSVPRVVIADIDVLRDRGLLARIIEALGGVPGPIDALWNTVNGAVVDLANNPSKGYVEEQIAEILDAEQGHNLSRDSASRIRAVIRVEDGWSQLKRSGIAGVPQGDATAAASALLDELARVGLFVVPVGELERWAPDVPGHGPPWASAALEGGRENDPAVREFMRRVDAFFAG